MAADSSQRGERGPAPAVLLRDPRTWSPVARGLAIMATGVLLGAAFGSQALSSPADPSALDGLPPVTRPTFDLPPPRLPDPTTTTGLSTGTPTPPVDSAVPVLGPVGAEVGATRGPTVPDAPLVESSPAVPAPVLATTAVPPATEPAPADGAPPEVTPQPESTQPTVPPPAPPETTVPVDSAATLPPTPASQPPPATPPLQPPTVTTTATATVPPVTTVATTTTVRSITTPSTAGPAGAVAPTTTTTVPDEPSLADLIRGWIFGRSR